MKKSIKGILINKQTNKDICMYKTAVTESCNYCTSPAIDELCFETCLYISFVAMNFEEAKEDPRLQNLHLCTFFLKYYLRLLLS